MLDYVKAVRACWDIANNLPGLVLILQELFSKLTELPMLVTRAADGNNREGRSPAPLA